MDLLMVSLTAHRVTESMSNNNLQSDACHALAAYEVRQITGATYFSLLPPLWGGALVHRLPGTTYPCFESIARSRSVDEIDYDIDRLPERVQGMDLRYSESWRFRRKAIPMRPTSAFICPSGCRPLISDGVAANHSRVRNILGLKCRRRFLPVQLSQYSPVQFRRFFVKNSQPSY